MLGESTMLREQGKADVVLLFSEPHSPAAQVPMGVRDTIGTRPPAFPPPAVLPDLS